MDELLCVCIYIIYKCIYTHILQSDNSVLAAILYINSSSSIKSKLYEGVSEPQPTEAAKRLLGDQISANG